MAHASIRALVLFSCIVALGATAVGCGETHAQPGGDSGSGGDGGSTPDGGPCCDASPDAPPVLDVGPPIDGGGAPSCDAQDAQQLTCPAGICDGLDSYAWDGERCHRIDCGTCTGADCGRLPTSEAACLAAHATCVPQMCRATGGDWLFFAQECQHFHCGQPQPAECFVGMPVCDCGIGRSFDVARGGCFDDTSCPVADPAPHDVLCAATGGTWTPGICCDTRCGQFCDLPCAADACVCGPLQIFDPARGCVGASECHVRGVGGVCDAQVRCQDGLICCQHCTGAGCAPDHTCQAPLCDSDPDIDECGNNRFAP